MATKKKNDEVKGKKASMTSKPIALKEVVVTASKVKPKPSRDSVTYTGNYDNRYKSKPEKVAIKDLVKAESAQKYFGKGISNANSIKDSTTRQRQVQGALDRYGVGTSTGGNTEAIMKQLRKDKANNLIANSKPKKK